jgi:hypothetical protein
VAIEAADDSLEPDELSGAALDEVFVDEGAGGGV